MSLAYNSDMKPTGIEGGIDTNQVPWIDLPHARGFSIKPLRASNESGMFTLVARLRNGSQLADLVHLGAMDLLVLSGSMTYPEGPMAGTLVAGTWAYVPANARIARLRALEDVEFLINSYGPMAFLGEDGYSIERILTSLDIIALARQHDVTLVPNTLAECMQPRRTASAQSPEPLAIAATESSELTAAAMLSRDKVRAVHPHFIDTSAVPWFVNPKTPDMGIKVLRVSEETGMVSLIVRHNGVAGPHYHLGAADFLILSGRIAYRAGPPEGYGPGVWFYEPAGARHDATTRIGDEDLIYTANVYGPLQFDSGRGTPITAVLSWLQYQRIAAASGARLVRNTFDQDASLLAWAPIGKQAAND